MRASICVLGPLLAAAARPRWRCPAATTIGSAAAGLARRRARAARCASVEQRARLPHRQGAAGPARRDRLARLPQRRRHREPPDGGGARPGHHGHRQRGARARDRRPLRRCSQRWARRSTVSGTSTLEIEGVDAAVTRPTHTTVPDRIVAGTWAFAAAMTRGDVTIRNARRRAPGDRAGQAVRAGAVVERRRRRLPGARWTAARGGRRRDAALPGVPHRPAAAWCWRSTPWPSGAAMVTENLFEARFVFVHELVRLGADVRTDGHHAIVRGVEQLSGAPVGPATSGPAPALVARRPRGRRRDHTCSDVSPRRPRLPGLRRGPARLGADVQPRAATLRRHQLSRAALPALPAAPRARVSSSGNTITRGPSVRRRRGWRGSRPPRAAGASISPSM